MDILREDEGGLPPGDDPISAAPDTVGDVMVRAWWRSRPMVADSVLALLLFGTEMLLWRFGPREFWPPSWPVAALWGAVGGVAIAIRRRWLWTAVVLLVAYVVLPLALSQESLQSQGAGFVVLTYTAAAYLPLRQAVAATLLLWVPTMAALVTLWSPEAPPTRLSTSYFLLFNLMILLTCFFIGRTVHTRRAYIASLEDRAATAEATQRALTQQAVADERRRIARELHDVVAHHVSVMGVLATGARRALGRDPVSADEALGTIEDTGRTALREMRRLLDVLRTEEEPAAEMAPQPGMSGVEGLVEQIREAGMPVRLTVDGDPYTMDPGVALTVYRIVQEALTNALKHAGQARAEVRLVFGRDELLVEVSDDGRGPRPGAQRIGHGLVGMRERVVLFGGKLRTGPRPGGGYRVYARIPVDRPASSNGAIA